MLSRAFVRSISLFFYSTHRLQLVAAEGVQARAHAHACVYMCLPTYACLEKPVVASFKPVSNQRVSRGESTGRSGTVVVLVRRRRAGAGPYSPRRSANAPDRVGEEGGERTKGRSVREKGGGNPYAPSYRDREERRRASRLFRNFEGRTLGEEAMDVNAEEEACGVVTETSAYRVGKRVVL